MADRVDEMESALRECLERLRCVETRLAALERPLAPATGSPGALEEDELPSLSVSSGAFALVGRTLLVLAGAYLARALTESGTLTPAIGVALGLGYAAAWQVAAARDARRGRGASASFHALASGAIAFPLIGEASARFGLLTPLTACLALVAAFALGLGVAWRHRMAVAAAATTILALATGAALFFSTRDLASVTLALLAIAAAIEWLAYHGRWPALRWAAAAGVDLVAAPLLALSLRSEGWPEAYVPVAPVTAALLLLALPLLYLGSMAARTLIRPRPVSLFEGMQGAVAVLLGLGGASAILSRHGQGVGVPGGLALALGALSYAAAFSFAERRAGQDRNFYVYSTAGAFLALGGASVLFGSLRAAVLAAIGVAATVLGRRFGRMTLRAHGALYLAAGAVESGLLAAGTQALVGTAAGLVEPAAWLVALLSGVAWAVHATDRAPTNGACRLPALLLAALVALALGRAMRMGAQALIPSLEGDAGAAAVACTGILAGLALAYALAARRLGWPELRWVAYALVAMGGAKLVIQDLPAGRPSTLVPSLALYGLALLLAPRLLRPASA
jgi:hypothetical protein